MNVSENFNKDRYYDFSVDIKMQIKKYLDNLLSFTRSTSNKYLLSYQ